ncbi:site-specific integrase [Fibrella sp. ES10-3-2-2]|nr:integrase [Fibrella sp. ES10-3-2-2]
MARATEHKESKATVTIVYRTAKTLADGSHPFWVRITKDRKSKFIATGLSLHAEYWNEEKGKCRRSVPTDKREALEAALERWRKKYTEVAEDLSTADEQHDAIAIATKVSTDRLNTRKFKVLSYFDELIEQFEQTGNVGNRKVYRDVRNKLQAFIGEGQDVPFDAVTVKFCNEWERTMKAEGLTDVTLSVKFRTLRTVLNKAIANGYAKITAYPFARNTAESYKFSIGKFDTKTRKRAISKADIEKIKGFTPKPYEGKYASLRDTTARELLAKNLFLFSYYCGGINFIDMAALTWANIITDLHGHQRLNYTRQKTGGQFSTRLVPATLAILERYRTTTKPDSSAYIFPILNNAIHTTAAQRHNRCNKIMGQVNADLKTIGEEVGIETPLTTYVARHSFATSLRMAGQDVAVISQAMGHADETTTRIYLKELGTELIDAAFECL